MITGRTARFAELAATLEQECVTRAVVLPPTTIDAILNERITEEVVPSLAELRPQDTRLMPLTVTVDVREAVAPPLRQLWLPSTASVLPALAHPIKRRPLGAALYANLALLVTLGVIVSTGHVGPFDGWSVGQGVAVGAVAGCMLIPSLIAVPTLARWWGLRRHAAQGWSAWVATNPAGKVCATALIRPASGGGWELRDVAAYPSGQRIGHAVMDAVCSAADSRGQRLTLTATNRAIAHWYTAHGFIPDDARDRRTSIPMHRAYAAGSSSDWPNGYRPVSPAT